jgi:hypothetical protein
MYQIDYNTTIENLLVPDKRTTKTVAFNTALVAEVSNNHTLLFSKYKDFTILPVWASGTYAKNELVKYGKSIFQSVEGSNTTEPSKSDKWRLVSDNFLGSDFRLAIRGEKLNFEFAINTWFETMFRQPADGVSDIFVSTNPIVPISVFRVGINEFESSKVFSDVSSELVINSYAFASQFNLSINVPVAVYNSLGATDAIRTSIIRSFADKYINAGLTYTCVTY